MVFLIFLLVAIIAYLIWRIADQLPDLIFRVSEMQRDLAELRRTMSESPSRIEARGGVSSEPPARPPVTDVPPSGGEPPRTG
jgi:predicted PurR-regulated permease PerM